MHKNALNDWFAFGSTSCLEQYLAGPLVYGYGAGQSFTFTIQARRESFVLLAGRSLLGYLQDLDGTDFGGASDGKQFTDTSSLTFGVGTRVMQFRRVFESMTPEGG